MGKQARVTRAMALALTMAAQILAWPFIAGAADLQTRHRFEIPAQALDTALLAFSSQADVQVLMWAGVGSDALSPGVRGDFLAAEALAAILDDTGFAFQEIDRNTIAIVRGDGTPLKGAAAEVSAALRLAQPDAVFFLPGEASGKSPSREPAGDPKRARENAGIEEVLVFGTLENQLAVGSKSGQSLREAPKSVSIVTRERIEVQNLDSLLEALNQTTGITTASYSSVDPFYFSRGFRVQTLQIDGGAPAYTGDFGSFLTPDTAEYERIEMLRGVDGIYSGAGEPGGVINLVRKRAKAEPGARFALSSGRWNLLRGEADATGRLTSDDRLRGRIVGAYEDKGYFYERGESSKALVFATLDFDLTPSTLLIAGASYERRREDGYAVQGFPRYADGRDLEAPRSMAFNPDWAYFHFVTSEAFLRAEQRYGTSGTLRLNVTRLAQDSRDRQVIAIGAVDPVTLLGPRASSRASDHDSRQDLLDLSATGTLHLFGREYPYTLGADHSRLDDDGYKTYTLPGYDNVTGPLLDVFHFDPSTYPKPAEVLSGYYPRFEQKQGGLYGSIGLPLAGRLRLTLGGRYGEYGFHQVGQVVAPDGSHGAPQTLRYRDSRFIPSVALKLDLARHWGAYASYAETFQSQGSKRQSPLLDSSLRPVTGEGFEVGVKGQALGVVNTAFSLYRIERRGEGTADPAHPPEVATDGSSCCYLAQGNVTSEGFDAEMSGMVLPGLQLSAGYAFGQTSFSDEAASPVYYFGFTPRHLLKVWSAWQLPGRHSAWSVSVGVLAQSSTYVMGDVIDGNGVTRRHRFEESGRAIWNASVQRRWNDTWSIGLYGDNLTDEKYYTVLGDTRRNNVYGTPRSYVLTLRGRW